MIMIAFMALSTGAVAAAVGWLIGKMALPHNNEDIRHHDDWWLNN